jgi:hypothetical protein
MSLSKPELKKLRTACDKLGKGKDYRCNDFVENLLLTAIDFQMTVEVVNRSRAHFREERGFKTMRRLEETLARYKDTESGNLELAKFLWNYKHRTRAKFLRVIVAKFNERGITGQAALQCWVATADFERDVRGQFRSDMHSIGYTIFHWLCLRCGVNTIKPDLQVLRFVESAIGRRPSPQETVEALVNIADDMGRETYKLDSAIWHYQRERASRQAA